MKTREYDERQLAAMDAVLAKIETDTMKEFKVSERDVNAALLHVAKGDVE